MSKTVLTMKKDNKGSYNIYFEIPKGMEPDKFHFIVKNMLASALGSVIKRIVDHSANDDEKREKALTGLVTNVERVLYSVAKSKYMSVPEIALNKIFFDFEATEIAAGVLEAKNYLSTVGENPEVTDEDRERAYAYAAYMYAQDNICNGKGFDYDAKGEEKEIQIECAKDMLALAELTESVKKDDEKTE